MSYNPTEWMTGDVITAEKLNKIDADNSYAVLTGGGMAMLAVMTLQRDNFIPGTYTVSIYAPEESGKK